jgi:hypothetical protein
MKSAKAKRAAYRMKIRRWLREVEELIALDPTVSSWCGPTPGRRGFNLTVRGVR